MTLIITALTKLTIYQSADFRLTDGNSGKLISDTSTKLVTLHYGEWDGFVAYTGIGRWKQQDTSEYVMQWLEGLHSATPADIEILIREKGTEWVDKIAAALRRRERHTFILAAFHEGSPQLAVISNFEDCLGRNDARAGATLTISNTRFSGQPRVVVSGWKPAVSRHTRRRLERLLRELPDDPERVRRMLAKMMLMLRAPPQPSR